jgi:hypothetical protein
MPETRITRIALTGASGNGKTTLASSLAESPALPFVDLEGADRAQATELVATDAWVLDATHFTLAELRAVYEAVWCVQLDAANFLRSVVTEDGWVIPTGRRARPGATGGKPAELYRAGRMWKYGSPIRRSQPNERRKGDS